MATITKRGKSWFAQVRLKGVSKSESFKTKTAAQAWAVHVENEILSGKFGGNSSKSFYDAVEKYRVEVTPGKRSSYYETYLLDLVSRAPFAYMRVSDITTTHLAQYRDDLLKTRKPSTVARYLGLINVLFEQMRREWKWINVNPSKDLRKPSPGKARDKIFSDEEIDAICSELVYTDAERTLNAVFRFALETAMRRGEILSLNWSDIDLEKQTATLEMTKNGDSRIVPLSIAAIDILRERQSFDKPFDIQPGTITKSFTYTCKKLGIAGSFHDSRHTAITRLASKVSPFELARIAGHRDLKMTLRYFNESAEDIAKKLD